MPIVTYQLYSIADLAFFGNTVTLDPAYDASNNVLLEVDDDDNILDGDSSRNEDGDDLNQFGTATFADGTVIGGPTTTIYSEQQLTLTAPNGSTITLYQIEVDSNPASTFGTGILAGFLPSEPLVPGVTYTFSIANTVPGNAPDYADIEGAVCFTSSTRIATATGFVLVEDLKVGDLVQTREGLQPIRWIGSRRIGARALADNPKLLPVRISQGALGNGLPERDLLVSRQHRMLVSSPIAKRMFGEPDALVSAIKMTEFPGIFVDTATDCVDYFHILFDDHQIIYAEGAPTESLFTGPQAMRMLEPEMREEILTLFPELEHTTDQTEPACTLPSGKQQKRLVARHIKNNKPFLTGNLH